MCLWTLILASAALFAGDEQQALVLRAQADFDRVHLTATPRLAETQACVQSQVALLPVSAPAELSRIHFRRGYCTLVGGLITRDRREFTEAAREFEQAAATWSMPLKPGNQAPPPVSSGVRVLGTMALLEAGPSAAALPDLDRQLATALDNPACAPGLMQALLCQDLLAASRQWRGWIAVRQNRLEDASRNFDAALSPGWSSWVDGQLAFHRRDYGAAAASLRKAVADWAAKERAPAVSIPSGLEPPPNLASALVELGGAQLLAGDSRAAIRTLDAALKRDASAAWPVFLRARAKETAGQPDAALVDYNLASRTAFAEAGENMAGDAHLYRGVWLFRRNDKPRAEEEFASALNFAVAPHLRADVVAWRDLAAVATGACGASRDGLEKELASVSPFFPKDEALAAMESCRPGSSLAGGSSLH